MRLLKKIPSKFWIILVGGILIYLLSYSRILNYYELITYDLRMKLRPAQKISPQVLIIEISDDTLKNLANWPLPRDFHASLVDVLKECGAKMIVFDLLFSEPTMYDAAFSRSIKNAGNVYLAFAFGELKTGRFPAESKAILADLYSDFRRYAAAIGYVNIIVDADGKTRKTPLFVNYNHTLFPQLGFKVACEWLGLNIKNVAFKGNRLIVDNKLSLPTLPGGLFPVNYPDKWNKSFKHFSYFEILKSYSDIKQGIRPQLDLSAIKDKVCFIGFTATGTSDLGATPLESVYPMLGLQASVFNSIVQGEFIKDIGLFFNLLINLLVFILSLIICLRFSPLKAFLGNAILGVIYFFIAAVVFIFWNIWIDLFLPLLLVILTYTASTLYRFLDETRKRMLLEKELDIARTIQKSFLPAATKKFSELSVSSFLQPAKFVAGDLYDILILDDRKIGIFIADVSGKGVPASLIMAQTISLFRIFARQYSSCAEVLRQLNKELYGRFDGRFVTGMYITVDVQEAKACVSSAAHSPLLLYKGERNILSEVELLAELPLGIMEDACYKDVKFDLGKNDRIIVFTDGLSEARNREGQEFGLENIKNTILKNAKLSSDNLLEKIKDDLFEFSCRAPQHDDVTVIVLAKE